MPEGDTIFRMAARLERVLAGRAVTRFESVFPALTRVAADRPLVGRAIESVASRGKHLLMAFSGDLTLHTHMRMHGSWHVYPAGARWRKPHASMRIVIATADAEAVGFDIPVAEFLTGRDLRRHPVLAALGPDLLDPGFDRRLAIARIRSRPGVAIGDVLLDQRVLAGIGNVFRSEILFVANVSPFVPAGDLDEPAVARIVDAAMELLRVNVADRPATPSRGRRTTGRLHPAEGLFVYGRRGEPCRRCGARIEARASGADARLAYWCPVCQPATGRSPQGARRS